jgi:hypothetical protein
MCCSFSSCVCSPKFASGGRQPLLLYLIFCEVVLPLYSALWMHTWYLALSFCTTFINSSSRVALTMPSSPIPALSNIPKSLYTKIHILTTRWNMCTESIVQSCGFTWRRKARRRTRLASALMAEHFVVPEYDCALLSRLMRGLQVASF